MLAGLRRRPAAVLCLYVFFYSLSVIVFFPTARYRAPILPPLIILAVMGARDLLLPGSAAAPSRPALIAVLAVALAACCLPLRFPTDTVNFSAELHDDIGEALHARGNVSMALDHFRKAVALSPADFRANLNLGNALFDSEDARAAADAYRIAVALEPRNEDAWARLGMSLLVLQDYSGAERALRKALALNPSDPGIRNNLALALMPQDRQAEAEEVLRHAVADGTADFRILVNLGNAFFAQGKFAKAARAYELALQVNPGDPGTEQNLIIARQRMKAQADAPANAP